MIQTFSSTIRRKEMDAVLTCMVDEKIGPGELNGRLIQSIKDFFSCTGAVALRSPALALRYALKASDLPAGSAVMISALAPYWHYVTIQELGYVPLILDIDEATGLVTPEIVSEGMKNGGRLLLLHETMGVLPDMDGLVALGVPVIEDISQSAGAVYGSSSVVSEESKETEAPQENADGRKAGTFGQFTIMGLEEHDIITGGGGAILMAYGRREWTVLKKYVDELLNTELLPDINSSLAWIQIKEYRRNEEIRKELFDIYQRSLLSGRNKTYIRGTGSGSTIWSFPVILAGNFKDAKAYTARKEIEIRPAYEESVVSLLSDDLLQNCKKARSLKLRCVLFPLYPRLGKAQAAKIAKVLVTLP
ncbi:MAG: DegT/DnrJ/EryC1/StrS family aminotransferase [Treponema sp.]|nr:DegT/DnrJ/EryC1/StrS family aminotransferase [Treponema sp.]